MQGFLVLILIFAVLVAAFAIQNTMPVVVKFLFWEANTSLVLVILGAAAAGAVILFLINLVNQIRMNRERKELNRQIQSLTEEKEKLERVLAGCINVAEEKPAAVFPAMTDFPAGSEHDEE